MRPSQRHEMQAPVIPPRRTFRGGRSRSDRRRHDVVFLGREDVVVRARTGRRRGSRVSAATCDSGSARRRDRSDLRRAGERAVRQQVEARPCTTSARGLAHPDRRIASTGKLRRAARRVSLCVIAASTRPVDEPSVCGCGEGCGAPPPAGSCLLRSAAMSSGLNSCGVGRVAVCCGFGGGGFGWATGLGGVGRARGSARLGGRRRRRLGRRFGQRFRLGGGRRLRLGLGRGRQGGHLLPPVRARAPAPVRAAARAGRRRRVPPPPAVSAGFSVGFGAGSSAWISGSGCGFSSGSGSAFLSPCSRSVTSDICTRSTGSASMASTV